jgi:hypothetical protein
MKRKENGRGGTAAVALLALLAVGSATGVGCSSGPSSPAPTNAPATTGGSTAIQPTHTTTAKSVAAPVTLTRDDWRRSLSKTPVPREGCFHVSRPNTTWEEVPCVTAPTARKSPARANGGEPHETVGGGGTADYSALVNSSSISWAEGSFPSVVNIASEYDSKVGSNYFSLQLNSNINLPTNLCANHSGCYGWEQFVYDSNNLSDEPDGCMEGEGCAYIQYWLVNYGTTCPSGYTLDEGTVDCSANSPAVVVTPASTIADLADLSLTGLVGASDTLVLSTGDDLYAQSQLESTNEIQLSGHWQYAEFNVFGWGNGSTATFVANTNTSIVVKVQTLVDSVTPTTQAPSIDGVSTTGEMNSLDFYWKCSVAGEVPGIVFAETTNPNLPQPGCAPPIKSSQPQLVWYDNSSGNLVYWSFDTTGNVYGSGFLLGDCGTSGSCSTTWQPVGTIANQLYWFDSANGYLLPWVWVPGEAGLGELALGTASTQTCSESSGCYPTWTPIGPVIEGGQNGYLWFDATSGQFVMWFSGSTTSVTLDDSCSQSNCQFQPLATADVNNDGNTDVIFQSTNGTPGIMVWTLNYQNKTFELTGTINFAETPPGALLGGADVNGDGHTDISFWNTTSGVISSWLLNGSGGITGTLKLNAEYAYSSSNPWNPVGYMFMP